MRDLAAALERRVEIFAISHIGHDGFGVAHNQASTKCRGLGGPRCLTSSSTQHVLSVRMQVFTLKQQIEHKCAFLREHMLLPGRPPVMLLGHSIGAARSRHLQQTTEGVSPSP